MAKKSKNLTDQKLLLAIIETRTAILHAVSQLPPEARNTIFLGVWSVVDVIAHLIGWDFTNLEAAKDIQVGKLPEFYARYDKDWKTYNAELVAQYRRDDFDELLVLAGDSQDQLIKYLGSIPIETFEKDFGVRYIRNYKVTIARLLRAELKDGQVHLKQIQEFAANL